MDSHTAFITNHSEHFVEARLDSARKFGYGNGSPLATMIASVASAVRRASATVERWARGNNNAEVVEYRLPRVNSAR